MRTYNILKPTYNILNVHWVSANTYNILSAYLQITILLTPFEKLTLYFSFWTSLLKDGILKRPSLTGIIVFTHLGVT